MTDIRAPYAYTRLLEAGLTEQELKEIGFHHGYWVDKAAVVQTADQHGLAQEQLMLNPEDVANQRFKSKLRGNLTSYLFEYEGAFRFSASPDHMRILGMEKCGDTALPVRVMDALLLERTLYQVIARAKHLLAALDSKFVASEHATVFRDQQDPGKFKPRAPYRQGVSNGFRVNGQTFQTIKQIASAYGVSYERLRRQISEYDVPSTDMSDDQWQECIDYANKEMRKTTDG